MLISHQRYDRKLLISSAAVILAILFLGIGIPESFAAAATWLSHHMNCISATGLFSLFAP